MGKSTTAETRAPEAPLYVSVDRAAKLCGVSRAVMRSWVNDPRDPIPHLRTGRGSHATVRVRASAVAPYARSREVRSAEWPDW